MSQERLRQGTRAGRILRSAVAIAAVASLQLFPAACAAEPETPAEPAERGVLELDYRGGYGVARSNDQPFLRIDGDGQVWREVARNQDPAKTCTLTLEELEDLRFFVLEEQSFGALDSEALAKEIEAAKKARGGMQPQIADLPSLIVGAQLRDGSWHEVSSTGLERDARRYPELADAQALLAIQRILMAVCEPDDRATE